MFRNVFRATRCLVLSKINIQQLRVLQRVPMVFGSCKLDFAPVCTSLQRWYSNSKPENLSPHTFETVCNETLESLSEYFEELVENAPHLKNADVMYSDGVLTVNFGSEFGTYVINRQTPNQQIWLSSPTSGPKRYDFVMKNGGCWIYKHDSLSLHQLLQKEIEIIIKGPVDLSKCSYCLL